MIEVEAKVFISSTNNDDVRTLRNKIRTIGKFLRTIKKVDDYYTLENLKRYPRKSLRIRKESGKNKQGSYIVNFKKSLGYKKGIHAKKETEFRVSDISGFLSLIDDFGFKKWLRKEKKTELYFIKENFHIELNFVKSLGYYLEVEYLSNMKGKEKARSEVLNVLKRLGVSDGKVVKEGYTKLLWDKK